MRSNGLIVSAGNKADIVVAGASWDMRVHELVVDPGYERAVIKNGKIVSRRVVERWAA